MATKKTATKRKDAPKTDLFPNQELLKLLNEAKFKNGLRIHTHSDLKPLHRDEYDFSEVTAGLEHLPIEEAEILVMHEYAREVEWIYNRLRSFYASPVKVSLPSYASKYLFGVSKETLQMPVSRWSAEGIYLHEIIKEIFPKITMRFAAYFPMRLVDIKISQGKLALLHPSLEEIEKEYFRSIMDDPIRMLSMEAGKSPVIFRIRRDKGPEALKSDFAKWVAINVPKKPKIGRRARILFDQLNHLAAWRAHRAGLDWNGYTKLDWENFRKLNPKKKYPYADSSSFGHGWKKASERLERFVQDP